MNSHIDNRSPGILDYVVFLGKKIIYKVGITNNAELFLCKKGNKYLVYLKYGYLGNIQYHKIQASELVSYIKAFQSAIINIDEGKI